MKVFCSWSGGKDSCLSCYKAMLEGHEVDYLFTMFTTTGRHTRSHRLSKELLLAQSQAIGIPVYNRRASWNTYEREFNKALAVFKGQGIQGGVFGDLYLDGHREWVEKVCTVPGITPFLPLWGLEGKDLLWQFVEAGFEAVVIAVKGGVLGADWLGRKIDKELINELSNEAVDICGEQGEYHTLVIDGPIFRKKIEIIDTKVTRRNGMSFLEVLDFKLEEKGEDR
ncbi:MAG: diphthine--ammonia ligase [Desulfobacterales bacterium]|nr:diphthine--ammonia ligase [Desulfobacterales bacterium]